MTEKPNRTAEMADILHQASMLYMASNLPIDYGTGTKYTSVEVHMLKYIIDHPGKTVTELSREWDRTKPAISQMLKRMEQKGLISWTTEPGNNKKQLYHRTGDPASQCPHRIRYERLWTDARLSPRNLFR